MQSCLFGLALFGVFGMLVIPSFRGSMLAFAICLLAVAGMSFVNGVPFVAAVMAMFALFLPVFLAAFVPGQKCLRKRLAALLSTLMPVGLLVGGLFYLLPDVPAMALGGTVASLFEVSRLFSEEMPWLLLALLSLGFGVSIGGLVLSVGRQPARKRQVFAWQLRQNRSRVLSVSSPEEDMR